MFAVEVVKDDHFPDKAWLRVTHSLSDRGASWSSVPLFSREEIVSVIASLQEFLRTNEIESCPSCELGLCPDGAVGFIPCEACGWVESHSPFCRHNPANR